MPWLIFCSPPYAFYVERSSDMLELIGGIQDQIRPFENGILVSDVVKQMVMGKEFTFTHQGEVALKGFEEPVRAWAVAWA